MKLQSGSAPRSALAVLAAGLLTAILPAPAGAGYGAGCPATCGNGDEQLFMRQGVFIP